MVRAIFSHSGCVSFESVRRPGHYVVHRDGNIYVEQGDPLNDDQFRKDASWYVRQDIFFRGFTSFESVRTGLGPFEAHLSSSLRN